MLWRIIVIDTALAVIILGVTLIAVSLKDKKIRESRVEISRLNGRIKKLEDENEMLMSIVGVKPLEKKSGTVKPSKPSKSYQEWRDYNNKWSKHIASDTEKINADNRKADQATS